MSEQRALVVAVGSWRLVVGGWQAHLPFRCRHLLGFALDALASKHTQHTPETNVSPTGAPRPPTTQPGNQPGSRPPLPPFPPGFRPDIDGYRESPPHFLYYQLGLTPNLGSSPPFRHFPSL